MEPIKIVAIVLIVAGPLLLFARKKT